MVLKIFIRGLYFIYLFLKSSIQLIEQSLVYNIIWFLVNNSLII